VRPLSDLTRLGQCSRSHVIKASAGEMEVNKAERPHPCVNGPLIVTRRLRKGLHGAPDVAGR